MDYNMNSGTIFMEDDKNAEIDTDSLLISKQEDTKELSRLLMNKLTKYSTCKS